MAEFTVVLKEIGRMCATIGDCKGCSFGVDDDCKLLAALDENDVSLDQIAEIERIVMDWAERHPERRYPTWKEWQEANFPEGCNEGGILPCRFVGVEEMERIAGKECNRYTCRDCANTEIPADIAEKLGIKPIGGKDDA